MKKNISSITRIIPILLLTLPLTVSKNVQAFGGGDQLYKWCVSARYSSSSHPTSNEKVIVETYDALLGKTSPRLIFNARDLKESRKKCFRSKSERHDIRATHYGPSNKANATCSNNATSYGNHRLWVTVFNSHSGKCRLSRLGS